MAKTLNRLTANEIKAAHSGANLNDGGGLFYRADKTPGSGQWKFRFTSRDPDFVARQAAKGSATRQRDMGLGTYPTTSLASARAKVAPLRAAVDAGHDPIEDARRDAKAAEREAADAARVRAAEEMTFGRYADELFLPVMLPRFTNAAHIQQWRATFATHARELREKPLAHITREDILAVLLPIWETKNVTAARSRERIERLFSHAIQNGYFTGDNPATWTQFDHTLTPPKKLTRGHHTSIPHGQIADFLSVVRSRQGGGVTALMLEWIALAACRTGEARFAVWDEIDFEQEVWTIPAARMKMRRDHVVPITGRMIEILEEAQRHGSIFGGTKRHVFPNGKGHPLSEMAALMFMRRLQGFEKYTVHGLRATFKGWAATETEFSRELIEEQLAHQLGAVERAYMRVSAVERRRPMMEAWAAFCAGEDAGADMGNAVAASTGSGE